MPSEEDIRNCNECGSPFLKERSSMLTVCPECSYQIYGYPNCDHEFENGICKHCLWNGNRSKYLKKRDSND